MEKRKYVAPQMEVFNMTLDNNVLLGVSIDKGEQGPNVPEAPRMEFFDEEDMAEEDTEDWSY